MRIHNPDYLNRFVDSLTGPEQAEIAAAVEAWLAAVGEADVRTFGALVDAFPKDAMTATFGFALDARHMLRADFDLANNMVVVKWAGRRTGA
jgi:hypothetical protein